MKDRKVKIDSIGNIWCKIGEPTTVFTAHMDCVHNMEEVLPVKGKIVGGKYDKTPCIFLDESSKNTALGTDDKAGIRILLHMIENEVTGLYIFTVEEECGCVGAKHAATILPSYIKRAICFDRRDTTSVITKMWQGPCCSDEFADEIIRQLDMGHVKDTGGSSTDTVQFHDLLDNYTNISVGYYNEHTKDEWLDTRYFRKLMKQVLKVDWENLPENKRPLPKPTSYGARLTIDIEKDYVKWIEGCDTLEDALFAIMDGCERLPWKSAYLRDISLMMEGLYERYFESNLDESEETDARGKTLSKSGKN